MTQNKPKILNTVRFRHYKETPSDWENVLVITGPRSVHRDFVPNILLLGTLAERKDFICIALQVLIKKQRKISLFNSNAKFIDIKVC